MIRLRCSPHYRRPSVPLEAPTASFAWHKVTDLHIVSNTQLASLSQARLSFITQEPASSCSKPASQLLTSRKCRGVFPPWSRSLACPKSWQKSSKPHNLTRSCTTLTARQRQTLLPQSTKTQRKRVPVPAWQLTSRKLKTHPRRCTKVSSTPLPSSNKHAQTSQLSTRRHNVDQQQDGDSSTTPVPSGPPHTRLKDVTKPLLSRRRLSKRSTAAQRASERKQQACPACGGRGFQIVDEVLPRPLRSLSEQLFLFCGGVFFGGDGEDSFQIY